MKVNKAMAASLIISSVALAVAFVLVMRIEQGAGTPSSPSQSARTHR